ncbi:hypothetical protein PR202_ga16149 [Eleusine coracana subsp. coracana]|uniref:Uncharacterized protein n=1 Tax=Eleusine coracana subsp. coracana TaxID=191504 RepID=A0AAV5CKV2_ELECO|nr:hypothetical protein PR202_ga16149 [Eleusine coracana subsp. coracana]
MKYFRCLGVFLDYKHNVITMSNFRVTCVLYDQSPGMEDGVSNVTARVYSHDSLTRRKDWNSSLRRVIKLQNVESAHYAGRSAGYMFWCMDDDGTVFACKEKTSSFTRFHVPYRVHQGSCDQSTFRFVDDDESMFSDSVQVVSLNGDELRVFVQRKLISGETKWVLRESLDLQEATRSLTGHKGCYFNSSTEIITAGKGYVVLAPAEEMWLFSVELSTMRVEREHSRNRIAGEAYSYVLGTRPAVHVCLVSCKKERQGSCRDICKCNK